MTQKNLSDNVWNISICLFQIFPVLYFVIKLWKTSRSALCSQKDKNLSYMLQCQIILLLYHVYRRGKKDYFAALLFKHKALRRRCGCYERRKCKVFHDSVNSKIGYQFTWCSTKQNCICAAAKWKKNHCVLFQFYLISLYQFDSIFWYSFNYLIETDSRVIRLVVVVVR